MHPGRLLCCRIDVSLLSIVIILAMYGVIQRPSPSRLASSPPPSRVTLNEFLAIPDAGDVEFIELLVGGTAPLAANRIALRDRTDSWRLLPVEGGLFVPGQFVVVTPDTSAFLRRHGSFPAGAALIQLRPWPTLNNGGDSLSVAVDGQVLDRTGWTASEVSRGMSRERISAVLPGWLAESWATSTRASGTPGYPNSTLVVDHTPPEIMGAEWVPPDRLIIHLDEPVAPDLSEPPQMTPFPQIPSTGPLALGCEVPSAVVCSTLTALLETPRNGQEVAVSGLTDLHGNRAETMRVPVHVPPLPGDISLTEVQLNGSREFVEVVVEAGWPVSLRSTGISTRRSHRRMAPSEVPLLLGPGTVHVLDMDLLATGETLVLWDSSGAQHSLIDSALVLPNMQDGRFRSHADRSLRRVGGAARDWASSLTPPSTPGTDADRSLRHRAAPPWSDADPPPLMLTEVMYQPLMDANDNRTDQTAFLEWTNRSRQPVDVFGMTLLDEPNERGEQDSIQVGFQPILLPPDSSLLIAWVPGHITDDAIDDSFRANAFLSDIWQDTPATALLQPVRASLGLRSSGRALILVDRNGRLLSHDRYTPEDHHPMITVTKGRSLERSRLMVGWSQLETSTHPDGASPGRVTGLTRSGADPGGQTDPWAAAETIIAELEPRSFYPDRPDLGASTHVVVRIPSSMGPRMATITVFNAHGHPVRRLAESRPLSGTTSIRWDGMDDRNTLVPAGIHFILVVLGDSPTWRHMLPVAVLRR